MSIQNDTSTDEITKLLDETKIILGELGLFTVNNVNEELYSSGMEYAMDQLESQKNTIKKQLTQTKAVQVWTTTIASNTNTIVPSVHNKPLNTPPVYIPKISRENRMFLSSIISALGEDEARRIIEKFAELIVKEEFSISTYIDNKLIEFTVTRE